MIDRDLAELDIRKFNEQQVIDNRILYHIGASLKDLVKQCFAFEILDPSWIPEIMRNL